MIELLVALTALGHPVVQPTTHSPWWGWGWDAHKIVCEIAYRRLTPEAKVMVDGLMSQDTIPSFAESCIWADAVKYSTHPATRPYHYVNIPSGTDGYDDQRDCGDPVRRCVVWAIRNYAMVLAESHDDAQRLEALKFVGHFIGDLHQPLHAGRPGDLGGNRVDVEFPDAEGTGFIEYNLHQIWDRRMLERSGVGWPESTAEIADGISQQQAAAWENFDVTEWTNDSYRVAEEFVYNLPENGRITEAYIERAVEYSKVAIQRAAVRLAFVLNSIADGSLR